MKRWIYIFGLVALAAGLPAQNKSKKGDAATSATAAHKSSFQGLGDFPGGAFESQAQHVSADGSVVVGYGTTASGQQAFRWTQNEGMVSLGNLPDGSFQQSWAAGVSADGSVIVGSSGLDRSGSNGQRAFRWTQSGGMAEMGSLDGSKLRAASGVSADGTVIVGDGERQAFRWTKSGGITGLGVLPGRAKSGAGTVSADGSVVTGTSAKLPPDSHEEAYVWTQAGGMQGLGYLPGGDDSLPNGISPDGSVIAGTAYSASGNVAFRWTRGTGMVSIGSLPGRVTHPGGVSANGAIIVGGSFFDNDRATAFIWDAVHGMRGLQSVLETEYGLNLAGWTLQYASSITPDGSVIVGWGKNPEGKQEAFRAVLAAPSVSKDTTPSAATEKLSFAETGQRLDQITGSAVALGDFNGDGILDAFVLHQDEYRVYFGDGRGRFTDSGQHLTIPSHVWGTPAVGDINGDGRLEVITGKTVWLNNGKGRFTAHPELIETSEDGNWTSVALADLNGDGHLDLIAIRDYTGMRVYFNDGRGHFRDSGQKYGNVIAGKDVIAHIALGDVNGDGSIDAVTAGWTEGAYCPNRVWLNDGKGKFHDSGQLLYQGTEHVHGAVLGDLNGDGHLDLVLGMNSSHRSGLVLLNDGHGHFTPSQDLGGTWSQGVALGDFDGDGNLDVFLLTCRMESDCPPHQVWLNDGHGIFRDSGVRLVNNPIPQSVALGDFNRDGRLDAFVVSATYSQDRSGTWVPSATPAQVWLNTTSEKAANKPTAQQSGGMRLEWTYFIGGSDRENLGWLYAPVWDRDGMLWFTGTTKSRDFPTTPDAFDSTYHGGSQKWGTEDIFLVKFNTRQPGVAYSTILGGAKGPEHAADLHVDNAGNVYIVGNIGSSDFPTTNDAMIRQFQGPDFRHADGFLTILSDGGRKLKYSTFIGGPKEDGVDHVFVEPSGNIVLFGSAGTLNFLPANIIRPKGPRQDSGAFAARLDAEGKHILTARIFYGMGEADVQRLPSGDFLIAGHTTKPDMPTTAHAFDRTYRGGDIYITRLSADLKKVSFATFFGGSGDEAGVPKILPLDGGDFFVLGRTTSKDLPVTADAIEKTMEGKESSFLARFSSDGRRLKYCTYLGGKGTDASFIGRSLIYDGHSKIYVTETTTSPDYPVTPDAFHLKHRGNYDIALLAFNVADNSLAYGSYLGGSKDIEWPGARLAFDQDGSLYVIGATNSDDFPTTDAHPSTRKGSDIFISKFSVRNDPAKGKP